jgi:hypothetical protein
MRLLPRLVVLLPVFLFATSACARSSRLPAALSDQELWRLIEELSEPPGSFDLSENFVSNEPRFAENIRRLSPAGAGAFIGVGPEQNFSYIAGLRSTMAFIVDIRRENLNLHLLYKALFELSTDRADFVSRLFSRPRPPTLASNASVEEIFNLYQAVPPSSDLYRSTAALVRDRLLTTHGFPLSQIDLDWIDRASRAFQADGPEIQFWGSRTVHGIRPSYSQLMMAKDFTGQRRSFLASEDEFRFVKAMHSKNLIVPVVGDFGGPHTIRRIGKYLHEHGEGIHAFYGSNVGVYLTNQQAHAFCGNLAALPAWRGAWFVENDSVRTLASRLKACQPVTGK